ncbi:Heavy metal transport/detoxification superfamily protein [Abeliophyllum distichum]|uniref:Heavy metal transport/detoxification superfamily protein n=1 Tax=Abeliophyllum distichum TaxID=126358 RepID=A0ABD1USR6_9LAMI
MADLQIVPAGKNVEAQYVEMMVPLYSYGCANKVKKSLANLKGIYSVNVDFHQQKVTVWGICNKYDLLSTVRKKRKEARFWNPEDNIEIQESKSAPPSPPHSLNPKGSPPPYLAIIKGRAFELESQGHYQGSIFLGVESFEEVLHKIKLILKAPFLYKR